MSIHSIIYSLLLLLPLAFCTMQAQTPKYADFWNDPVLSAKIDQGIERNRKNDAVIRVTDSDGKPLPGVRLTVEQVDSSFHFGANIFMLGIYPTPELNRRYEEAFCKLFNSATVPFFWRGLEPEQGKLRFAADSTFIARRPPPDAVIAFCEEHGLRMHGHPLVWMFKKSTPDWFPDDPAQGAALIEGRLHQIGERYGHRINRWDVVNEVVTQRRDVMSGFPSNYDRLAFSWAERYFPASDSLYINETTGAWDQNRQPYTDLIQQLLNDKARISGIGLQFHLFSKNDLPKVEAGTKHKPGTLLEALDHYAHFGLPVHISEITLACPENDEAGQALQARIACSYYRLWFSHPVVNSITWWNFPDGGGAPGEEKLLSGLLTTDLQPKAAYDALYDLIHREWRTNVHGTTGADGSFALRAFHGNYKVRLEAANITRTFLVSSGNSNELTVKVPAAASNANK